MSGILAACNAVFVATRLSSWAGEARQVFAAKAQQVSLPRTRARLVQALRGARLVSRIADCSRVFALELDQTFPDAGNVFNGVSQRCLKLSGEVEAFIRGDNVGGVQVEVVVEPVAQLEQDRLGAGDNSAFVSCGIPCSSIVASAPSTLTGPGRDGDPASLAPWPANATVERFVPQVDVLPHCSVVVSHGGSGTTYGALAHGLPLLMLPHAADQFDNVAAARAAGVANTLMPHEIEAIYPLGRRRAPRRGRLCSTSARDRRRDRRHARRRHGRCSPRRIRFPTVNGSVAPCSEGEESSPRDDRDKRAHDRRRTHRSPPARAHSRRAANLDSRCGVKERSSKRASYFLDEDRRGLPADRASRGSVRCSRDRCRRERLGFDHLLAYDHVLGVVHARSGEAAGGYVGQDALAPGWPRQICR